jgi:hypothetical protein
MCILHGIPFIMYYNHTSSPITGGSSCAITNIVFQQYYNSFNTPVLTSSLPIIIIFIFGILAYRNVQHIAYRTIPLVRRELDKQLTVMVLVQVFCNVVFLTPSIIENILRHKIGNFMGTSR